MCGMCVCMWCVSCVSCVCAVVCVCVCVFYVMCACGVCAYMHVAASSFPQPIPFFVESPLPRPSGGDELAVLIPAFCLQYGGTSLHPSTAALHCVINLLATSGREGLKSRTVILFISVFPEPDPNWPFRIQLVSKEHDPATPCTWRLPFTPTYINALLLGQHRGLYLMSHSCSEPYHPVSNINHP